MTTATKKATTVIDNTTGATALSASLKRTIKVGGKKVTISDLVKEAKACDKLKDAVRDATANFERDAGQFQIHFLGFAASCKTAGEFGDLCYQIEQAQFWGRAPKGTPEATRKMYTPCSQTWKTYKSNIITSWKDAGIKPLSVITVNETDKETGEVTPVKIKLDTINKVRRAASATKPKPDADNAAGVHVDGDGDATIIPVMTEDMMPLAQVMSKLGHIYEGLDADLREQMMIELTIMVDSFQTVAPTETAAAS